MGSYLLYAFSGAAAAALTFYLQKWGCTAVVASCLVGLLGALIAQLTSFTNLALVIFAGSFVGMASLSVGSIGLMLFAGALAGIGFELSTDLFKGHGGKLGTLAFISTIIALNLFIFIKNVIGK